MALAAAACGNKEAQAPSPTTYKWPGRFAYKLDYVQDAQSSGQLVLHYAESRIASFRIREDEAYEVAHDSVIKTTNLPHGPLQAVPPSPEDTLAWFVKLGPLGEIRDVQLGCDPAVVECQRALPSSLPIELRRIVPRLSQWPVPMGSDWTDTLSYDDAARPEGTRGTVITNYRVTGDTVVSGQHYWVISWRAVHQTWASSREAVIAEQPLVAEDGMTFVDKARFMPVYSAWAGATSPRRIAGETATVVSGFRGRAYLAGSPFDSILSRQ